MIWLTTGLIDTPGGIENTDPPRGDLENGGIKASSSEECERICVEDGKCLSCVWDTRTCGKKVTIIGVDQKPGLWSGMMLSRYKCLKRD